MEFKIPFTLGSLDRVKKKAAFFISVIPRKGKTNLSDLLKNNDVPLTREEYLGISLRSAVTIGFLAGILATTILIAIGNHNLIIGGILSALVSGSFVFSLQQMYPRLYVSRRQKEIEKNLIPALGDMLVQLNAGVPLFSIMVNISSSEYGELSNEFKKAVKKMNAGTSQTEVLDELGKNNPSNYFRRTLWQLSNGMKAGSDIAIVIRESIKSLNQEQVVQIQTYGNKLNPLIMFYMLISVILPSLAVTFLTILSSMVNLDSTVSKTMFIGLFALVTIIQIMFLGVIKSTRPSLL